jgi:predicted glutamine amidotransferase
MCRLFACIAKEPVNMNFSFFEAPYPFKDLIKTNQHGWGIGWYDGKGSAKVFKEGIKKVRNNVDKYNFSVVKSVESKIILSHVRDAIWGDLSTRNNQPVKYRKWLFAHNGDVDRDQLQKMLEPKMKKQLKTDTDSESYFFNIMQRVKKGQQVWEAVSDVTAEIMEKDATAMNFVMSDGENIYAYRNYKKYVKNRIRKHTLYYLIRDISKKSELKHASARTHQLMYSEHILKKRAVLICSERLTDEEWVPIKKGQLIQVDKDLNVRLMILEGKK